MGSCPTVAPPLLPELVREEEITTLSAEERLMNIVHSLDAQFTLEGRPINQWGFTQEKIDANVAMGEQILEMTVREKPCGQLHEEEEEDDRVNLIAERDRVLAWRE